MRVVVENSERRVVAELEPEDVSRALMRAVLDHAVGVDLGPRCDVEVTFRPRPSPAGSDFDFEMAATVVVTSHREG